MKNRAQTAVSNRISCAWAKFNLFSKSLINKHIPLKLRLKLFDAIVAPTAVCGLATSPLTAKHFSQLDCTRNEMMRKIIGWPLGAFSDWHEFGQSMKLKMETAMVVYPVSVWNDRVRLDRRRLLSNVSQQDSEELTVLSFNWLPSQNTEGEQRPWRRQGRPCTRWTDGFCD